MQRTAKIAIAGRDAGKAVESFLAARFSYHPLDRWKALAEAGRILVNGNAVRPGAPLAAGDILEYRPETAEEPPVDSRFSVLLDAPAFLIVGKSGNLPCHPAGRYFAHTLWALLRDRPGLAAPAIVNRLDRETSGIVVVAKGRDAARKLGLQFARRQVAKRYTVFVEGAFPDRLDARGWLVRDAASPVRKKRAFVSEPRPGAESAETLFIREGLSGGISRLAAIPATGRTHQIRATLSSLGFPVVGDKLYGVDSSIFLRMLSGSMTADDLARLRVPRQALHASFIRFRDPSTGGEISCAAPLPADLLPLCGGGPQ